MSEASMTYKYIPPEEPRQPNFFIEEYYSSTDTKIYFNDEEQTEIGYINYSVQEQLKPIYGYASRTWDDVAVGNRVVTGAFKMPIKNPEQQTVFGNSDIFKSSQTESNEQYNETQQALKDNIDWVNNSKPNAQSKSDNTQSLTDLENTYRNKLHTIGYTPNNEAEYNLKNLLMRFQNEYKTKYYKDLSSEYGELGTETRKAIDALYLKHLYTNATFNLPVNTIVYSGPGENTQKLYSIVNIATVTQKESTVDSNGHTWVHVFNDDPEVEIDGWICPDYSYTQ